MPLAGSQEGEPGDHGYAALAAENARLYGEAQEALRLRDEFLASVTHDLNNPLTNIKGYAQVLRRRTPRLPPEESQAFDEALARIDAMATRMQTMLAGLLDLTNAASGHPQELNVRATDLVVLVRECIADAQQSTVRHEIRFTTSSPSLRGFCDSTRIERVLANLLTNAIKYSPGGPIAVALAADGEAGDALLTITDQGVGVPTADLPHLFERYYRAGNVRTTVLGSGLGLASAKQIVEQHGGAISVTSTEGAGTTFHVRLPLKAVGR